MYLYYICYVVPSSPLTYRPMSIGNSSKHAHTHTHTHTRLVDCYVRGEASVLLTVRPTKNSVCHRQELLSHRMFVMKTNHCSGQPSKPRLQWTFPGKQPPSLRVSQTASSLLMVIYVIMSFKVKNSNFVTFQDVWWVRISITPHFNSIHMIINCPRV